MCTCVTKHQCVKWWKICASVPTITLRVFNILWVHRVHILCTMHFSSVSLSVNKYKRHMRWGILEGQDQTKRLLLSLTGAIVRCVTFHSIFMGLFYTCVNDTHIEIYICFNSSPSGQNCRHSDRRHFQVNILEWKLLYSDSNFTKICPQESNWQ